MASVILLQSVQGFVDFTGDPAKADGWYGYPDSLYTIAINTNNFIGRVFVEASLALTPGANDWFTIPLGSRQSYVEFPIDQFAPTGVNGGDTGTVGFTFTGNYLYIRTRVMRSYLYGTLLTQDQISELGDVRIILSQSQTTYSSSTSLPPIVGFTQLINIGQGYQVYAGLNEISIPQFRSLTPGSGIIISQTANALTISTSGSTNSNIQSEVGSFIELSDSPGSYVGKANFALTVNTSENGLNFTSLPAVSISGLINDASGVLTVAKGGTGLTTIPHNGIAFGSANNQLGFISAPSSANTILTWNGTAFVWDPTFSLNANIVVINTGSSYTATGGERYIIVRKTNGSPTLIVLPTSPASGNVIKFKDGKGDAVTNPITISAGSLTIDSTGTNTIIINSARGSLELVFDGTMWTDLQG